MDQYLQGAAMHSDFAENGASFEKWKSLTSDTLDEPETNSSGGFECNICLDVVQDPVVTFCGHLYCWPCIYRWISYQDSSMENPDRERPQCPVCKSEVSQKTLIPLYGRGQTTDSSKDKVSDLGILVPQRPPSPRCTASNDLSSVQPIHHQSYAQRSLPYHAGHYTLPPMLGLGGSRTHLADPMIGMFGEMVYARIFGNSESTLYAYPTSYRSAAISSPRLRRHMMEADRSLFRVCFFLCCCLLLCLLLF